MAESTPAAATAARGSRQQGALSRRYSHFGAFDLELGGRLEEVTVAYETYGTLNRHRDNAVLVLHALTGDAHAAGGTEPGQPTPGWWDSLIGPGKAIDTDRWFVVSSNVLGGCQGTTGPSSIAPDGQRYGSRWPRITIRDQVGLETKLADYLGIDRFALVAGGSMGGMRALEWAIGHPDRVGSVFLAATGAAATADQIGTQTTQIQAILNDPDWCGGDYLEAGRNPSVGLGLARRIAHLTYRTESELQLRFGRDEQPGEAPLAAASMVEAYCDGHRYAVQSYLDHHAHKLVGRFDAGTYVALTDAMNTHDVGRGRGGLAAALGSIQAPVTVVGVDTDRLYPLRLQQDIADLAHAVGGLQVVASPYGHDGFLLESDAIGDLLQGALATVAPAADADCA
ncbi:MAG TPA: homoserine O-acetyltransferase [Actinomycetota bacterium]|nr:homoserine O-acetyltransferase [Actinomycetota bacterium]